MNIVKKLTLKTCGNFTSGRIKKELDAAKIDEGAALPLLKFAGEATSAQTGQTEKGTFTRFRGMFVGTDLVTGEIYTANEAILPEFLGAQLAENLTQGPCAFAFEFSAIRQDTAIYGYAWAQKSLVEVKVSDRTRELMKLAGIVEKKAAPALTTSESPVDPDAQDPKAHAADAPDTASTEAARPNRARAK